MELAPPYPWVCLRFLQTVLQQDLSTALPEKSLNLDSIIPGLRNADKSKRSYLNTENRYFVPWKDRFYTDIFI